MPPSTQDVYKEEQTIKINYKSLGTPQKRKNQDWWLKTSTQTKS